ncbi:MmcB family DNA repair protein [Cytobacillus depressus]|nr:MmcB family DNA repair protein [Cytobacillus depressus]
MKATITGSDVLSKRILADLNSGLRVSEVPNLYPVSLDQAKRLSRFKRMLHLANEHLEEEHCNRFMLMGLKSLPLAQFFKKADWAGIIEILSVVTEETTRDELQILINGLAEKRKRIAEFKENADLILLDLENTDQLLREKEMEFLQLKKAMEEKINLFKKYTEPVYSFLIEYLGLYEGKLVLAKRVNANWQRDLKKKRIIVYDEEAYVYFLIDFNAFVDELKSSHQRGLEYRWNPDKDIQRMKQLTPWVDVPEDGKYKLPSALNEPMNEAIKRVKNELKEIREKRLTIEKELRAMKKKTVHSYREMAEVSDFLSTINLKRHKDLQDKALKWLHQRGFIAVAEFTLPNGKKADIFAYNESQIVIFDVKASKGDLVTDKQWTDYLPYCHDFYLLTPPDLEAVASETINDKDCGQFVDTDGGLKMIKPDNRQVDTVDQQKELVFAAGQLLSRKFIYGY